MTVTTVAYKRGVTGNSARLLARSVGIGSADYRSSRRTRGTRNVINWGVSDYENWGFSQRHVNISQPVQAAEICANKIRTLETLADQQVPHIQFLVGDNLPANQLAANAWLESDGKIVVRNVLNGHSGVGIQIIRRGEAIPYAPLYTRYFKKNAEYRLHVAFGSVILIQQKRRQNGHTSDDSNDLLIRTHGRGWNFCVNDLDYDSMDYRGAIQTLALRGAEAVGLNHGAVEILVKHEGGAYKDAVICEINSAPSLSGDSSLAAYTAAFAAWIRGQR